jgi:DNA-binding IclR family transcriptional regulator
MAIVLESHKSKIAKRMIEVFEYFDEHNQTATVMDLVRRYGRPQSSTSELLTSLVEMGLLYKDARSRCYSPTPRMATLGTAAQPSIIREGRLFAFMDQLAYSTRRSIALFGMVGTHAQIFRLSAGTDPLTRNLGCGTSELLSATTAGLLLLSALDTAKSGRILWRLNAEAPSGQKFNLTAFGERINAFRQQGHATGPAGFVTDAQMTVALVPGGDDDRPLALGAIYPNVTAIDAEALLATIRRGIARCVASDDFSSTPAGPLVRAV